MATVPLEEPWKAPSAAEWDGQTFETWKQDNTTTDSGRFLLDLGIESVFLGRAARPVAACTLFYIAAAGNEQIRRPGQLETADGAQDSRFVGGSQRCRSRPPAARQPGRARR